MWMPSATSIPTVTFMACRCGCILEPPFVFTHVDVFWGLGPPSSFMALWTGMYSGTPIPRVAFLGCGYRLRLGPAAQLPSTRSLCSHWWEGQDSKRGKSIKKIKRGHVRTGEQSCLRRQLIKRARLRLALSRQISPNPPTQRNAVKTLGVCPWGFLRSPTVVA